MSMHSEPASPIFGQQDASFKAAGGYEGIRQLVDDFYQVMDTWETAQRIRSMHPGDLSAARDKLTRFLCGWLGGPRLYLERYGQISIPGFHAQWPINGQDGEAWLGCMAQAVERQNYSPAFKEYLLRQLSVPAQRIIQASAQRHPTQS